MIRIESSKNHNPDPQNCYKHFIVSSYIFNLIVSTQVKSLHFLTAQSSLFFEPTSIKYTTYLYLGQYTLLTKLLKKKKKTGDINSAQGVSKF